MPLVLCKGHSILSHISLQKKEQDCTFSFMMRVHSKRMMIIEPAGNLKTTLAERPQILECSILISMLRLQLLTGSVPDQELTKCHGMLQSGDSDKGFDISYDLLVCGCRLNMPPFVRGGHMSKTNVINTRKIASPRIHVERAIGPYQAVSYFE